MKLIAAMLWLGACALQAQTLSVIATLTNEGLTSGLVQGIDGNFYGTACGNTNCNQVASSSAYKVSSTGVVTTLAYFDGASGGGILPQGGLLQSTNGDLYGTTQMGGINHNMFGYTYGTVYKLTTSGTLTTIHSFNGDDGYGPTSGLVQATNGNLYGSAPNGGLNGTGTIFKVTPKDLVIPILNLNAAQGTDAPEPNGLIQATDGNLYGTTYEASAGSGSYGSGYGTVFKITQAGVFSTLYDLPGYPAASNPIGPLVQASNGAFYGLTAAGGINYDGTIFRITPAGVFTILHVFGAGGTGGPACGALTLATDGNFYGMASGPFGQPGSIFKVSPQGVYTVVYNLASTDPQNTQGALLQATDGSFYGADFSGPIFRFSTGLAPFVKALSTAGPVGAEVSILGTDLSAATGVTFNGVAAAFTVVSPSEITAVVPAGATTGAINVALPTSTLSSNQPFRVQR